MLRFWRILAVRRRVLFVGAALAFATSIAIATHLVLFFRHAEAALGAPLPAAADRASADRAPDRVPQRLP
jgi:hypothetical protein